MPETTSIRRRAAACLFTLLASAGAANAASSPLLVADIATGQVLEAREATTPWYPASLTKLMTTYVVLNAVRAGKLSLQQPLVYTERAQKEPPSKMGLQVGQTVTVDDALKMLMVQSANDIAFILAEGVSGSVEAFVVEMNRTARQIGMANSNFVNPNGLPVKPGPDLQRTTARDMAVLASALYRDHPQMAGLFALDAIKIGQRTMRNHNGLMGRYPGTDGMKTGYVCSSGYNVVATATRGGRRLVTVVLGAYSPLERSETAVDAFERGFAATKAAATLASLPQSPAAFPIDLREDMCGKSGAQTRKARRLMLEAHPWAPALMSKPAVSPVMVYATPAPGAPDVPAEPSGVDEDAPAAAKPPATAEKPAAKKPAAKSSSKTATKPAKPAKSKAGTATKKPAPSRTKTGRTKIELQPSADINSSAAARTPGGAL